MHNYNLIWLDLEMTGLNTETDKILEIASLITDKNFNILTEGPVLCIHQTDKQLNSMNKWNFKTHRKTGLLQRVKNSPFNEKIVEYITLKFLKHWGKSSISPLCGNNINQDRRFLSKHMPKLEAFFHYRSIDVNNIKNIITHIIDIQNIYLFIKKNKHIAYLDIKESVNELLYYINILKRNIA